MVDLVFKSIANLSKSKHLLSFIVPPVPRVEMMWYDFGPSVQDSLLKREFLHLKPPYLDVHYV